MNCSINYRRASWLFLLSGFALSRLDAQSVPFDLTLQTVRAQERIEQAERQGEQIEDRIDPVGKPIEPAEARRGWAGQPFAYPEPPDTLRPGALWLPVDELLKLGQENNLRLKAARLRELQAEAQEKTARAARWADIGVGATVGYLGPTTLFRQGLSHPSHPAHPDWSHNYNLEVTQPLYRGGKIRRAIHKAELEKQTATLQTAADQAEIKLLLLGYYLDLFNLYKEKEVWQRTVEESLRRLKDIRQMRKEGLVTRNDEIRSELQLTTDRLALRETTDNITIVSQQLDQLAGLDEETIILPDTSLFATVPPLKACDTYLSDAYLHYPELSIARYATRLASNELEITRADYLPALSLRAANTLSRPLSTTMQDLFSNNWNIALTLSYSLSSLYQNPHKMQAGRQYIRLRQNAEEQLRQDLRQQVRTAYIKHQEALDRVGALRLSVEQAEENYRIVNNRYKNQLSILTDLLDASNVRLEAELHLTHARTEVLSTYYQLLRASGLL